MRTRPDFSVYNPPLRRQFVASHYLGSVIVFFLIACWASAAEADNRHVTPSGSGIKDGSDWSNACDGFTGSCSGGSLVRGDTYYVADGDYRSDGAVGFWKAASGTTRITIKKATVGDHGASTGWSDTMGDGEALFDKVYFDSDYWTWEGQVGSGTSGYGFKIQPQTCLGSTLITAIDLGDGNDGMRVAHTEVAHCGVEMLATGQRFVGAANESCTPTDGCGMRTDGLRSSNANHPHTKDLEIRYVYIHDLTRNGLTINNVDNVLIEHIVVARVRGVDEAHHGQAISFTVPPMDNVTIRHSTFIDINGSAGVSYLGSNGETYTNQYFYGNLFYTTSDTARYWYSPGGIIWGRQQNNQNGFYIYNNTAYNIIKPEPRFDGTTVANVEVRNNIYVNSEFSSNPPATGVTSSHNSYFNNTGLYIPVGEPQQQIGTDSPFVNAAAGDFRLKGPTFTGMALDTKYSEDLIGVPRGTDGVWDRGAYEFRGLLPPKPPTNLRVIPPFD